VVNYIVLETKKLALALGVGIKGHMVQVKADLMLTEHKDKV
jgi:hypothetical protein